MDKLISVVLFVLGVSLFAFLHELGHFLSSKLFGIEVEEFGFGFPPKAVKLFTWQGTDFTLNWIPFGAFVRPKGENDPNVTGGLGSAHPLKRLVVFLGGPVMNMIAGIALFAVIFLQTGGPDESKVIIASVVDQAPAAAAGLLPGDQVISVNGTAITGITQLSEMIHSNTGKELAVQIDRKGAVSEYKVTPRTQWPSDQGPMGIGLGNPIKPVNLGEALSLGTTVTIRYCEELFKLPARLIMGQLSPQESRVVSIVGMYQMFDSARTQDQQAAAQGNTAVTALTLMAIISVALGITNLLPLPALDGGRILFLIPELIFRRRVPAKYENAVHMVGFMALLLLMVVVVVQDLINPITLP